MMLSMSRYVYATEECGYCHLCPEGCAGTFWLDATLVAVFQVKTSLTCLGILALQTN